MSSALERPSVLVLNRNWQAIDVKTPAEAFGLMATGAAMALDISTGDMCPVPWTEWLKLPVREVDNPVRTVRGPIRAPTVLVLTRFGRVPMRRLRFSLRGLWMRDRGVCQYTGRKLAAGEGNIDHVMPRSRGGRTNWENCVLSHKTVNHKKGNRTPEEAGLRLMRRPEAPRAVPATAFIKNTLNVKDWEVFLSGQTAET